MSPSAERLIDLEYRIAATEKRIKRQRKTIERMGREGRDARTAAFVLDYFLSSLDKMVSEQAQLAGAPVRSPRVREEKRRASPPLAAGVPNHIVNKTHDHGDRVGVGWLRRLSRSLSPSA